MVPYIRTATSGAICGSSAPSRTLPSGSSTR